MTDDKLPFDKISDDGRIAVLDHDREAWAEPDLIARSNAILDQNKSRAKIETESGFLRVNTAGREHYLKKLKMVDRGAGWWTRHFGDPEVDLTDDCGSANQQMMGAEATGDRMFVAASTTDGQNQEFTGKSAYRPDDTSPGGSISTTEQMSGEIYVRMMKRELDKTLTREDALRQWAALTDAQRGAFAKKYGINKMRCLALVRGSPSGASATCRTPAVVVTTSTSP